MIVTSTLFEPILRILETQKIFIIDVETDGLEAYAGNKICGIGVGISSGKTYYFPFRHKHETSVNLTADQLQKIIQVLNNSSILIGYNIKFDLHMLLQEGLIPWDKKLIDVLVMVRLIEKDRFPQLGLTKTIDRIFGGGGEYDVKTKEILKKNKWIKDFSLSPESILGPYCEQDVSWTRKLYAYTTKIIRETDQQTILELQIKLTKVLLKIENIGITLDLVYGIKALAKIRARQQELLKEIYKESGSEFNVLSSPQVGKVFEALGIKSKVVTEKGNSSWNEAALFQIDLPLAGLIKEYRTLEKMGGTYIEPFIGASTIHGSFCNWGTITGRLSSREPNLQNIPRGFTSTVPLQKTDSAIAERIEAMIKAREGGGVAVGGVSVSAMSSFSVESSFDDAREDYVSMRRLFVARPGFRLYSFDYSQMEVRVFISYFNNSRILKLMNDSGFDFHSEAAKAAFHVDEKHADWYFYRQLAKAITFGVIYGIGTKKLAIQLSVTEEEARKYKKAYFHNLEGSREFIEAVQRRAAKDGYVSNRFGRKYYIPEGKEYVAVNYLVQGTSADIISERMIEVANYLLSSGGNILIQIHDELICELPEIGVAEIAKSIHQLLEDNSLGIRLKVDMKECFPSWAHKK